VPKLPGIPHKRAIKAFKKAGFRILREGKHTTMSDERRIITIPRANPIKPRANPINAYTMGGIIKDAGLTIEEFKRML